METTPRVTVIVPTLNRIDTLERTLCSVIDQGYANLELMVVDGGSDDGSATICEHYPEIAWWVSGPDDGPADAINKALQRCTGEIVLVLPSDDVLLPGALDHVVARMVEADQPAWIIGSSERIDIRDEVVGRTTVHRPAGLRDMLTLECGPIPVATTFYRRDALARFGAFDRHSGDAWAYEMACRFIAAGLMPVVLQPTVAAEREPMETADLRGMISRGRALLAAAERHASELTFGHRFRVTRELAQRHAIYSFAEREAASGRLKQALWSQLLRHPHWLSSENYRRNLLEGTTTAPLTRAA